VSEVSLQAGEAQAQAPPQERLHSGFLRSAARWPDAVALRVGATDFTYEQVENTARRWAAALLIGSERPLRRVGVFAYRNEVSYVGVLACLLAGAAFVPLHGTLPDERIRLMLEAADLDAVIVDADSLGIYRRICASSASETWCLLAPESAVVDVPGIRHRFGASDLAAIAPLDSPLHVDASDPAYILFTSGTTGRPKGVPISHANVAHFLHVNQERYALTPEDSLTQTFDQTFDLSVFDLFMAWGAGATLVGMQPIHLLAPHRFLVDNGITVWFSVPSVVALLRKQGTLRPGSMPTLRWSLFCGEALPREAAEQWQLAAPNSVVENLYGPTELTIACSVHRWEPLTSPALCVNASVPIGRLYPGLHGLVMDDRLEAVPDGGAGELCVAGAQTFHGYLGADRAASKLIDRRGPEGTPLTYYRTGDRVRMLPNGDYAYLGRVDHQVKVGGYRVELAEIEAALSRSDAVVGAVAVGWPVDDSGAIQGIVGFVVGAQADPEVALSRAREVLPHYMHPRHVHALKAFPLNANGKIDRNRLRQLLADGEL
jgi:amino acid adenylation domain-containing protein